MNTPAWILPIAAWIWVLAVCGLLLAMVREDIKAKRRLDTIRREINDLVDSL